MAPPTDWIALPYEPSFSRRVALNGEALEVLLDDMNMPSLLGLKLEK